MENRAQKLDGPGMDALEMAAALKRMLAADNGELAQRLDTIIRLPIMKGQAAMFYAIVGAEPEQLAESLEIALEAYWESEEEITGTATCPACHHANGLHEPDCGAPK